MAQPTAYNRQFNFSNQQALTPSTPVPANKLDLEYNALKATIDGVLANLALIQRDDGEIANDSVGRDQLAPEIEVGFNVPTKWVTSTAYTTSDTVFNSNNFYRCLVAHTSGTFSTDLAALKWELVADFSALVSSASIVSYDNSTSGLTATDAQDAIDELASEKLAKTGGTMTGVIAMGANKITGVADPSSAQDAMTKAYSDANYQPLDSDLTAIAALTTTAYGRALLALADEAAFLAYVNLEAADLLTSIKTVDGSGSGLDADLVRGTTPGATGLALLDDASAAAARTTLGIVAYDVYTGSSASNTSFPLGTPLWVSNPVTTPDRAGAITVCLHTTETYTFIESGHASSGTALSGTWRQRGRGGGGGEALFQRTA